MNIPTKPFRLLLHTLTLSWVLLLALATSTYADSATWSVDPTNDNWNSVKNWTPNTIPNSITDVATFDFSNTTNVSVNNKTTVQSIVFSAGASAYTIAANSTQAFTMSGGGITNASGLPQTLVVNGGADLEFTDAATVDKDTTITVTGSTPLSDTAGYLIFHDTSSAAEGAVVLEPGSHYLSSVNFYDSSSAGNSLIIAQEATPASATLAMVGLYCFAGTRPPITAR